jgi:hypothetical protein
MTRKVCKPHTPASLANIKKRLEDVATRVHAFTCALQDNGITGVNLECQRNLELGLPMLESWCDAAQRVVREIVTSITPGEHPFTFPNVSDAAEKAPKTRAKSHQSG